MVLRYYYETGCTNYLENPLFGTLPRPLDIRDRAKDMHRHKKTMSKLCWGSLLFFTAMSLQTLYTVCDKKPIYDRHLLNWSSGNHIFNSMSAGIQLQH